MARRTLGFLLYVLLVGLSSHGHASVRSEALVHVKVGVILDMDTLVGKMCWTSISMAVDDFYAANTNYTTRLVLLPRDGKADVMGAGSAALGLVNKEGVLAILGPQKSAQARLLTDIGDKAQIPIISFTATSPVLSNSAMSYCVRAALSDSDQVDAVASLVKFYEWREAAIIYEDSDYGNGVIPFLIDALQANSIRVPNRVVISPSATDDQIMEQLFQLRMIQTRVFIVHMSLPVARRLFSKAMAVGIIAKEYAWIVTDGIASLVDSLDQDVIRSMQGFLGVKPYVARTSHLDAFARRWKKRYRREYLDAERVDLSIFSLWAYDSVTALAQAVEKTKVKRFTFNMPKVFENSTDLDALPVSNTGPAILKAVKRTSFTGLNGEFRLVNGQLRSSAYQIINVIGNGYKGVGFWRPKYGLTSALGPSRNQTELGSVVWPGDTTVVPRGWEISSGGKRLRVGFPLKDSFFEFVGYETNPKNNKTIPTGYSIEIFQSVMKSLPYFVPFEFVQFNDSNGTSSSYDGLLQKISEGVFDAVAGDVTIRAHRFKYADFTLPYTGSGVYMIVPLTQDNKRGRLLVFMEPLTKELWLCSLCFFLFTGFTVWAIERMENNEDFQGPPGEVISNVLYFTFSTLVFAQRQELRSSLSKAVVIVWVFAVLILTSTYTASLASILTAAKLKPAFSGVNEVVKSGKFVGYSKGSFLGDLLKPTFGSKLIPLTSPDEYNSALSNGTVVAVFHELPYIRLFLKKYCTGYTIVGPTQRTAGMGFAFRKDSPLVSDVSKAVVDLMQDPLMDEIEKKWMLANDSSECTQADSDGGHISLYSLRGLFLLTGVVSSMALLVAGIRNLLLRQPEKAQSILPLQPTSEKGQPGILYDERLHVDVQPQETQDSNKM